MTGEERDEEILHEGRWLRLVRRGRWEYVQRKNADARGVCAALVVACTDHGEILLVEQYRTPVAARTIELPAGLIADEHTEEDASLAAARELEEETGYRPATMEALAEGCVSAGLSGERLVLFFAHRLRKVGEGGGVDGEDIVVHRVPLSTADEWLAQARARGLVVDLKVYVGLRFAEAKSERPERGTA